MYSLKEDLNKLTSVQIKSFDKVFNLSDYCIGDYIEQTILNNEQECTIDIGIGYLKIFIYDDSVKYQFIPNTELENTIKSTVESGVNSLKLKLDNTVITKLTEIYKRLL